MSNPRPVGEFISPKTKAVVRIIPKKGESVASAVKRVTTKHGSTPGKVKPVK